VRPLKIQSTLLIGIGLTALASCGSGSGGSNQPSNTPASQTNSGQTYPNWVPHLTEHYDFTNTLTSCTRIETDSDGYILSTASSNPSTDIDRPVTCTDEDQNTTYTEFTYSTDRSQFSTLSQSNYSPYTECQNVALSAKNMPYQIVNYISGTGNFNCSPEDGLQFSLQLITLEDEIYETLTVSYGGAGPDGMWETDDDLIQARYVSTWTPDKLKKRTINYLSSGIDAEWNTDDDLIIGTVETFFKEDMIPDYTMTTSPGLDGQLDTVDDIITGYTVFTYENGDIKNHTAYASAGPDGVWETAEDNYKQYTIFY